MVEAVGADLIDLNFGCPVKKVTKTGAGATMLDDHDLACRIVEAIAGATLASRHGQDAPRRSRRLAGLPDARPAARRRRARAALTLHPRSAVQMYTGTADHSLTAELVAAVDVPVVASGDITSRARAQAVLATTGATAVMVGRAAQGNPWALAEIVDGVDHEPTREEIVAELVLFMRETVRELGERRASGFLKKFYGWYLAGGRFPTGVSPGTGAARDHRRDRAAAACVHAGGRRPAGAARGGDPGRRRDHARASDLDLRRRVNRRFSARNRRIWGLSLPRSGEVGIALSELHENCDYRHCGRRSITSSGRAQSGSGRGDGPASRHLRGAGVPVARSSSCSRRWVAREGIDIGLPVIPLLGLLVASALSERILIQLGPRSWYSPSTSVIVVVGLLGGPVLGAAAGLATKVADGEQAWRRRAAEGGLAALQGIAAGTGRSRNLERQRRGGRWWPPAR